MTDAAENKRIASALQAALTARIAQTHTVEKIEVNVCDFDAARRCVNVAVHYEAIPDVRNAYVTIFRWPRKSSIDLGAPGQIRGAVTRVVNILDSAYLKAPKAS